MPGGVGMIPVADESALAWLQARTERDLPAGLDAGGWLRSVWILHAMYERPDLTSDLTYHDLRQ